LRAPFFERHPEDVTGVLLELGLIPEDEVLTEGLELLIVALKSLPADPIPEEPPLGVESLLEEVSLPEGPSSEESSPEPTPVPM